MGKPTILCVDDEIFVLHSLKQQLEFKFALDYDIEIAESGLEALSVFEELTNAGEEIPLIITDFIMPEMRGDELLKKVNTQYPETASILLTGQATLQGIKNAVNETKFLKYIAKPWDKEMLYSYVEDSLNSYFHRQQQKNKNEKLREINTGLEQTVWHKTNELEKKKRVLGDIDRIAVVSKIAEDMSQEVCCSLQSIKQGIDTINTYKNNIQKDEPQSIAGYLNTIDSFYKAASKTISNLVFNFERNMLRYIAEPGGSTQLMDVLLDISSKRVNISDIIDRMLDKNTEPGHPSKNTIEKIAAWDEEDILLFNIDEVLYFATESSSTIVITNKGKFKVKDGLDKLEKKLCEHHFYRCHRGFLVNLNYVSKIMPWIGNNSHMLMIENHEIPISRNRIQEMKRILGIA